jgi:hypothetical protein
MAMQVTINVEGDCEDGAAGTTSPQLDELRQAITALTDQHRLIVNRLKLQADGLAANHEAITGRLTRMENVLMATQAQVDALTTRVTAVGDAVTTGVAGIRSDLDAIRAANPDVDLSALEGSVTALEASTAGVTDLDAEFPVATPVEDPAPVDPNA